MTTVLKELLRAALVDVCALRSVLLVLYFVSWSNCVCLLSFIRIAVYTVVAAGTAYVWRDTTDDIQYYGGFVVITSVVCHSSTLSYHCNNYMLW